MLLLALACAPPPTPLEQCERCADPDVPCAVEEARACTALSDAARIADPVDATAALGFAARACAHDDGVA